MPDPKTPGSGDIPSLESPSFSSDLRCTKPYDFVDDFQIQAKIYGNPCSTDESNHKVDPRDALHLLDLNHESASVGDLNET